MRERLLFVLLQINRQIIIRPGSFKAFQQDQSSVTFMRTDPSCSTLSQIRRPEQTYGNWGSFVSPIICRPIRAQECGQIIVQRFNYPGTFWDILARWSLNVLFLILRSDLACRIHSDSTEKRLCDSMYASYARPHPHYFIVQCTLVFELASAPPCAWTNTSSCNPAWLSNRPVNASPSLGHCSLITH